MAVIRLDLMSSSSSSRSCSFHVSQTWRNLLSCVAYVDPSQKFRDVDIYDAKALSSTPGYIVFQNVGLQQSVEAFYIVAVAYTYKPNVVKIESIIDVVWDTQDFRSSIYVSISPAWCTQVSDAYGS